MRAGKCSNQVSRLNKFVGTTKDLLNTRSLNDPSFRYKEDAHSLRR